VGRRGPAPPGCRTSVGCDVIYSERRGQSQKPEEIYHLIEELVPNGAPSASVLLPIPIAQLRGQVPLHARRHVSEPGAILRRLHSCHVRCSPTLTSKVALSALFLTRCRARRSGKYLELFGRKNNLRNHWVTVGNEVTGTGLPLEDQQALHATQCIPGAVYGARHRTKL